MRACASVAGGARVMCVGDEGDRIYGFQFNEVNNEVTLRKSSKESKRGMNTAEHKHVHPLCQVERGTQGAVCCGCDWVVLELEDWK